MDEHRPPVSIVISIYNGEKFLREAIESILSQTFTDFEVIVIDDGSVDSTPHLLALYEQRDPRILIHRFGGNRGLSAALNFGIRCARGKYIARMDADDISLPYRLEEQVKFMDEHPEIDVLGTAYTLIDESGHHLQTTVFPGNSDILRWSLLFFNPIAHPSTMMRTSTIRKVGGYNTELTSAQDYELWTRVTLAGRLSNLQKVHMLLRLHGERITYKHREQQIAFTNEAKRKYTQVVLDRDIPSEVVNDIRQKPTTARHAVRVASLILDYCNYCSKNAPTPSTIRIMGSALAKSARKVGRFVIYPATWEIGIRWCLLSLRLMVVWFEVVGLRLVETLKDLSQYGGEHGKGFKHE